MAKYKLTKCDGQAMPPTFPAMYRDNRMALRHWLSPESMPDSVHRHDTRPTAGRTARRTAGPRRPAVITLSALAAAAALAVAAAALAQVPAPGQPYLDAPMADAPVAQAYLQQALSRAHRGYVLETGRIVKEGTGQDLLHDPAVKEAYLGVA